MNWSEFMLRANELLRRPDHRSGFGFRQLIQIIVRSQAAPPESWDVLSPDEGGSNSSVFVRTWHQEVDYPDIDELEKAGYAFGTEPFRDAFNKKLPLHPTISEDEFSVNCTPVITQMAMMESIRLPQPFQGEPPTGIAFYEVILGNFLNGVTFRWWDSGPPEWCEAIQVTMAILSHLRTARNVSRKM
jgi:hypothetical protein